MAPASRPPNVLLILADDQGYGDLSCHGNPYAQTPNLDRLAAESVEFTRFHVSPVCAPTRASLLTGRYHLRCGVHGVTAGRETMRAEEVTVAEALKPAGYHTALYGKWHLGEHYPYVPFAQGFDEFIGFRTGHWINYWDARFERNGRPYPLKGYATEALTELGLRYLETQRDRPFLLNLAYNVPHTPWQAPARFWDQYRGMDIPKEAAAAYALNGCLDEQVGRLLRRLDELKLADDTIVLYLSDNGPNGQRYNCGLRGIKGSVYEGGTRASLFVRWRNRLPAGRKVDRIAAHVDIYPTLLELCGVQAPKGPAVDGVSLKPLLHGEAKGWPERMLFTHSERPANPAAPYPGSVRTQRFNLVNGTELYDVQSDPGERRDIAAENPSEAQRLRQAYETWFAGVMPAGGLQRYPIPVGHDEENPVTLAAPQALLQGKLRYWQGNGWAHDWITNWVSEPDRARWELDVVQAGRYQVSVHYLCPAAGAKVTVRAGTAQAGKAIAAATPMTPMAARDLLPRKETPEMHWAEVVVGAFDLVNGRATLDLQVAPGAGVEVRDVVLRRLGK
jgi:arylsulfatase A